MAIRRHAATRVRGDSCRWPQLKEVNQRRLIKSNAGAALGRGASRTGSPRAQRRFKAKTRAGGAGPGHPGPLTSSIIRGLRAEARGWVLKLRHPGSEPQKPSGPSFPLKDHLSGTPTHPPRADAMGTHQLPQPDPGVGRCPRCAPAPPPLWSPPSLLNSGPGQGRAGGVGGPAVWRGS